MNAREFYKKRLKEDCTLGSIELMEEYAEYKLKEVHLPDVIGGFEPSKEQVFQSSKLYKNKLKEGWEDMTTIEAFVAMSIYQDGYNQAIKDMKEAQK